MKAVETSTMKNIAVKPVISHAIRISAPAAVITKAEIAPQSLLMRVVLGEVLREVRVNQSRTLREVSKVARVSLGYLSEVERGQKEASSELLAAICGALRIPLSELFRQVSDEIAVREIQNVRNSNLLER